MASSSGSYHEPVEELSTSARELHRAVVSVMEELEAVDWYNQRAETCSDNALRAIIEHNRDEEVEHAIMTLEWIRRHHPVFDREMRKYLFTQGDILGIEEDGGGADLGLIRMRRNR